ncbi:hypothetical protein D3C80_1368460 [compost metagenome]
MFVGTPLCRRHHAVMRRTGDDFRKPHDPGFGAIRDILVGGKCGQCRQALEIDREIGSRVEFRHFPVLEMVEPCPHPRSTHFGLLRTLAAGTDKSGFGEKLPGKIGGGMKQQCVVFRKIPLHVIARLIHPVTIVEDGGIDAGAGLVVDIAAPARARPDQRHQREIGAVMAILDRRQDFLDHRIGIGATKAARQPGKGANRVALGIIGYFGQRIGDTLLK